MSKKLFSLTAAVGLLFSASSYAEIVNMKVVGTGTCMPYSADFDPQKAETIVDFGKRIFDKTSATLINAEGFTKPVSVKQIGNSLFSFAGSYHQAKFNVGSCNFIIEKGAERVSHAKQSINDENVKDMANIERLEKQLNSLLSKLEGGEKSSPVIANEPVVNVAPDPVKAAAPTQIVADKKEQSAPIVERTYVNLTPEVKTNSLNDIKTTIDDWTLEPLSLYPELPILKWERDKSRNAFRVYLKTGKGYEIFYARNNEGQIQYKGKVNDYHVINVPYFAHDKIDIRIKDAKGKNYNYVIRSSITEKNFNNEPIIEQTPVIIASTSNEVPKPIVVQSQKFAYLIKSSLRDTLDEWKSNEADKWEVIYDGDAQISFGATALLNADSFSQAISMIAPSLLDAGVRFDLYPANKVLKVTIAK